MMFSSALKNYFSKRDDVAMAFLFGSYARGVPMEESDIDIAVVFSKEDDEEKIFESITDISYELSKIIKKEVNVIPIFRDFRKPMLYYNAVVLGAPIFIRDRLDYVNLLMEALFQVEDFNLFGRRWRLKVASNFLGH